MLSRAEDAEARYLIPAQISLVDRLDVSEAKSPRSMQATFNDDDDDDDDDDDSCSIVRVTASKAMPAPVAPPPMTRMS